MNMMANEDIPGGPYVLIDRPALTRTAFRDRYNLENAPQHPLKEKLKNYIKAKTECSTDRVQNEVYKKLPFIEMLKGYQWKKWLKGDIIAGLSVGVIHIPQGMGFALLTNVPPVYGLYSSMFPLWLYFLFGTSKHLSVGTMALISLMIGAVVTRETSDWSLTRPEVNSSLLDPHLGDVELNDFKMGIATSVTLLMGIFQLIMWLVKLDILATYMSMSFISAFMTGAAIHIIISQLPALFGIRVCSCTGTLGLPRKFIDICANLPDTVPGTIIAGIICMVILIVIKEVLNDKVKKIIKVPIPAELLVVIVGTIISHTAKLDMRFGIKVIGHIPTGIPAPSVPTMYNASSYIVDSVIIAIVGFAICVSMGKLISKRKGYVIDTNQEMLAYGLGHVVGSFFFSFGGAQAPPRTLVCESTGGQTQLAGLISTFLPLIVVLTAGPLFEPLPTCVLAAIIIVALLPLLKTVTELPQMWHINQTDFAVYIITLLSTVILSVIAGLAIGIIINIFLVVVRMQLAKIHRVMAVANTEVYVPEDQHKEAQHNNKVMVFRFDADLFFANVESFKARLFENTASPVSISQCSSKLIKEVRQIGIEPVEVAVSIDDYDQEKQNNESKPLSVPQKNNNSDEKKVNDVSQDETNLSSNDVEDYEKSSLNISQDGKGATNLAYLEDESNSNNNHGDDRSQAVPSDGNKKVEIPPTPSTTNAINEENAEDAAQTVIEISDEDIGVEKSVMFENGKVSVEVSANEINNICNRLKVADAMELKTDTDKDKEVEVIIESPSTPSSTTIKSNVAKAIILDCSAISYIDIMGLNTLLQIKNEYEKVHVTFALASCREPMVKKMILSGLLSPDGTPTEERTKDLLVFPSVKDAVQILSTGLTQVKERGEKVFNV